jgi:hypothetical protein
MMIAAANAPAQATRSTELLTIRAVLMAIFFTLPYLLNASLTCAPALLVAFAEPKIFPGRRRRPDLRIIDGHISFGGGDRRVPEEYLHGA